MYWSATTNNQCVSWNTVNDAATNNLFVKQDLAPLNASKMLIKSEASTYFYLNTSYAPYAAKRSLQLVVKSDLVPSCDYSATLTHTGSSISCSEGMDVVFLVDFTGSMGGSIGDIKTTITAITSTIITESSTNYRLGLVVFDENTSATVSNYSSTSTYTNLPSGQKYVNTGVGGAYQWITCLEKMSTNNETSFKTQLDKLNTVNFPLGNGIGSPEPSDMGLDLVGTNRISGYEFFAGTFRTNVSRFIILITDQSPSGNDDNYNNTDITFVTNLTPELVTNQVRVLLLTTASNNVLYDLAVGTNGVVELGFNQPNDTIRAIENSCA